MFRDVSNNMNYDETFEAIIDKAIEEAERVKCPMDTFYAGLRAMRHSLDRRIAIEQEDMR